MPASKLTCSSFRSWWLAGDAQRPPLRPPCCAPSPRAPTPASSRPCVEVNLANTYIPRRHTNIACAIRSLLLDLAPLNAVQNLTRIAANVEKQRPQEIRQGDAGGGEARTDRALSFYARARTLTAPFPKFYQAPWQSGADQSLRSHGAAGAKKRRRKKTDTSLEGRREGDVPQQPRWPTAPSRPARPSISPSTSSTSSKSSSIPFPLRPPPHPPSRHPRVGGPATSPQAVISARRACHGWG